MRNWVKACYEICGQRKSTILVFKFRSTDNRTLPSLEDFFGRTFLWMKSSQIVSVTWRTGTKNSRRCCGRTSGRIRGELPSREGEHCRLPRSPTRSYPTTASPRTRWRSCLSGPRTSGGRNPPRTSSKFCWSWPVFFIVNIVLTTHTTMKFTLTSSGNIFVSMDWSWLQSWQSSGILPPFEVN